MSIESIGSRIKKIRIALKLNQASFGKYFDVGQPSVSSWENNEKIPEIGHIIKMAEISGAKIDWILKGDDAPESVSEGSSFYGLPDDEIEFINLYRGSDPVGREDAKYLLERHQVSAKKKAGQ